MTKRRMSSNNSQKLHVQHLVDQHGEQWFRVGRGRLLGHIRASKVVGENARQRTKLVSNARGPLLVTAMDTAQLEEELDRAANTAPTPARLIDRQGWIEDADLYAATGRDLPLAHRGSPLIDVRIKNVAFTAGGTLKGWKRALRLVRRNPLLQFVLAASFVGPVLPFLPEVKDNIGFELLGPTSIGKTTLMRLAASVWGDPDELLKTWDTTAAGLGTSMLASDGTVFLLDEASRAGRAKNSLTQDLVHQLADGRQRARFNEPPLRPARFCFLSTSNLGLNVTPVATEAEGEALSVRLPTILAHRSALGVLDRLSADQASAKAQIAALQTELAVHHGWAGPRLARTMQLRAQRLGWDSQQKLVREYADSFRALVPKPTSPAQERVLQKFAVVYAVGRLAYGRGLIPQSGQAIVTIYNDYVAAAPRTATVVSAIDVVRQHLMTSDSDIVRLGSSYREHTLEQVKDHPGFIRDVDGFNCLVVHRHKFRSIFAGRSGEALHQLDRANLIVKKEGRQVQTRVRRNPKKDRMYAIKLDALIGPSI